MKDIYTADYGDPYPFKQQVLVVGCGGTGSYVAEGLCRILPPKFNIVLQDYDKVEERNLLRQNFFESDLGKFKSQVLAERFARNYKREIGYKITAFNTIEENYNILIGCVDNHQARKIISRNFRAWWIDSGNNYQSGQVLIGNINKTELNCLKKAFDRKTLKTKCLPNPSIQEPAILTPVTAPKTPLSCAEAVEQNLQSPIINQAMATLVLQSVHSLITNSLNWMAAYINLEIGELNYINNELYNISCRSGLKIQELT